MNIPSWSELAALVGLIAAVCSILGTFGMLYLYSKFISKKTHYHDKDALWVALRNAEERVATLEKESALAKQPIITMQKSVEDMQKELAALVIAVTAMDKSVTGAIHGIDKRVALIEAKQTKRRLPL